MAAAVIALGGCQKKAKNPSGDGPKEPELTEEEPSQERLIETGGVKVMVEGKDGKELWTVWGKGTNLSIKDRIERIEINGVHGTLTTKSGKPSKISADHGFVSQAGKSLEVDGKVKVESGQHDVEITAKAVRYSEQTGLIEATGEVWVIGKSYKFGPSTKLLATPDLKKIGTEDRFEKRR